MPVLFAGTSKTLLTSFETTNLLNDSVEAEIDIRLQNGKPDRTSGGAAFPESNTTRPSVLAEVTLLGFSRISPVTPSGSLPPIYSPSRHSPTRSLRGTRNGLSPGSVL